MSQDFTAGDFLVFQIESGYGLLRLLSVEDRDGERIWHLSSYNEMFLDIDTADRAAHGYEMLTLDRPHLALTNRAFEATQTARMENTPLSDLELEPLRKWRETGDGKVSDLSVRLLLGLR